MSLLDRISASFNSQSNALDKKEKYSSFGFQKNALAKNITKQGTLTRIAFPHITDEELAFHFPMQFIYKYLNRLTIQNAMKINSNIEKILYENGLTKDFYIQNVNSIIMSHLIPTARKAKETYLNLGHRTNEKNYLYLVT